MRETVAIWYRGATYELGRGRDFYGIWPTDVPGSQPFERWPLTTEGWYGAWSRFVAIERPGTIVPASQPGVILTAQPGLTAASDAASPATGPDWRPAPPAGTAPFAGLHWRPASDPAAGSDTHPGSTARRDPRAVVAALLLAAGVACGFAGLFPAYIAPSSLASATDQLVPHVLYLAGWTASAVLILLGGARLRFGALLGTGLSIVTFGFFFADAGQVIAGGSSLLGAGLVLALVGWLACAAGSALAFRVAAPGRPARPRPRRVESLLMVTLAAVGAAVALIPAWDSFTLRVPGGPVQTITAGYVFASPGAVIAGNVVVMVALVAVAVAASVWRPVLLGGALLAGAIVPMAAQAISAIIQIGQVPSPEQFGISPAQASLIGLRITSGLTAAFWIYLAFVVVLAVLCARMFFRPRSEPATVIPPAPAIPSAPAGHDVIATQSPPADETAAPDVTPPATSAFS